MRLPMNRTILIIAILVMISNICIADELRIGHVDLREVVARSDEGRESRDLYIKRAQKYQEEIRCSNREDEKT